MRREDPRLAARIHAALGEARSLLNVGAGAGAYEPAHLDVTAVEPSAVMRAQRPEAAAPVVDGRAEALPFDDDSYDVAAACLVVHFMSDPVGGLAEMKRVTRDGGWVGATVWDLAGSRAPMAPLWDAVAEVAPEHPDESDYQGGSRDSLIAILEGAALRDVEAVELAVTVTHPSFVEWWEPYLHGVGPAGEAVAAMSPDRRARAEEILRRNLGEGPFDITAVAWAARGRA